MLCNTNIELHAHFSSLETSGRELKLLIQCAEGHNSRSVTVFCNLT